MDNITISNIYSVSEITKIIRGLLEDTFENIWVRGEVSNFVRASSGHFYFTLKDDSAQIRTVCFRGYQRGLKFVPQNGKEILARGKITVYEPRGEYQLIVEEMHDVGLGKLQLAFEQLKEKLRKEGLFDDEHKKALPAFPRSVGVVTSPTGAAIRDILQVLKRRNSSVHVVLYPAQVQGEGAAEAIVEGIKYFNTFGGVDVIIVGRGGGSLEDLWAFNEEIVARAIAESEIPIISAVGHEIDFTIADFVADLRAPTPSAGAELVAAAADELVVRVESLKKTLVSLIERIILQFKNRLNLLILSRNVAGLKHRIVTTIQYVDDKERILIDTLTQTISEKNKTLNLLKTKLLGNAPIGALNEFKTLLLNNKLTLVHNIDNHLKKLRNHLRSLSENLDLMNPKTILERGYAVCLNGRGQVVKAWDEVKVGDHVDVMLSEGALECEIEKIKPDWTGSKGGSRDDIKQIDP